jgi:vacuolar-type H+-ATPase subunit E/Vma4
MSVKGLEAQIKELIDKEIERILDEAKRELDESIREIDAQIEKLRQYLKAR